MKKIFLLLILAVSLHAQIIFNNNSYKSGIINYADSLSLIKNTNIWGNLNQASNGTIGWGGTSYLKVNSGQLQYWNGAGWLSIPTSNSGVGWTLKSASPNIIYNSTIGDKVHIRTNTTDTTRTAKLNVYGDINVDSIKNRVRFTNPVTFDSGFVLNNYAGGGDIGGYEFDGVDDYVSVANNDNLNFGTNDFSYEIYFRYSSVNTTIINKIDNATSLGWRLYLFSDGNYNMSCRANGRILEKYSNISIFSPNKLYHIVVVISRLSNTIDLYVNSIKVTGIYSYTSLLSSDDISNVSRPLLLGQLNNSSYTNKNIYLTRLYNYALSQSDVALLYNNGRPDLVTLPYYMRGASNTILTSGTLTLGKLYRINTYVSGDNFTNVATVISGTINTTGCVFIAKGSTPTAWTNSSELQVIGCVAEYRPELAGRFGWLETQNRLHGTTYGSPIALAVGNNELVYKDIKTSITGNTTLTNIIPKEYRIKGILINNTTANSVTINIGTSSGGSQVVSAKTCPAGLTWLTDAEILQKIFSLTSDQTLYVSSSDWNSASLNIEFTLGRQ